MANKVAEHLKVVLADSYILFLKTQNYHWNVTGPNFHSLHVLFEEQYQDLFSAIDVIAERIRALGEKAPGSFASYTKLTNIKEEQENINATQMVKNLAEDQKVIADSIKKALNAAQEAGDEATDDILVGRLEVHEKNSWMLSSSI